MHLVQYNESYKYGEVVAEAEAVAEGFKEALGRKKGTIGCVVMWGSTWYACGVLSCKKCRHGRRGRRSVRRDRHMLAVIGHVGHPHKRALVHAVNTRQFEMPIGEMQSAAVRRLAAMMQRDDDEAEQVRQQKLEEEWRRAAAAHKAAEHKGIDAKTKKQVKYCAGKLAAWLEVHGAAAGYIAAVGPTVDVMKAFSSYCFANRKVYSTLGNQGMGASFGFLQVPYLVPM